MNNECKSMSIECKFYSSCWPNAIGSSFVCLGNFSLFHFIIFLLTRLENFGFILQFIVFASNFTRFYCIFFHILLTSRIFWPSLIIQVLFLKLPFLFLSLTVFSITIAFLRMPNRCIFARLFEVDYYFYH